MVEGVLAVDRSERVVEVNRAACEMLGLSAASIIGRSIQEVTRDYELLSFVRESLAVTKAPGMKLERTISLRGSGVNHLQVSATPMVASSGNEEGVLIVLHDVSQLRRLENIRREFVANVSHELRTPITSIKGFVEALQDGAVDNPEEARRFLTIISRQVKSLLAIIEDLLSLSRIEKESEEGSLLVTKVVVDEVINAACDVCRAASNDKQIELEVVNSENLQVMANPTLLEQAIVNLIQNAIKYSEAGKLVRVAAEAGEDEVKISVSDQGWGIAESELPRIFERFYRIDKGRDRKSGSTGLGLAIVKHVVSAHRGQIKVESTLGSGSCFMISIPNALGRRT